MFKATLIRACQPQPRRHPITIDPLPLGLRHFSLRGVPVRGRRLDILWRDPDQAKGPKEIPAGLTVLADDRPLLQQPSFHPGHAALSLDLPR